MAGGLSQAQRRVLLDFLEEDRAARELDGWHPVRARTGRSLERLGLVALSRGAQCWIARLTEDGRHFAASLAACAGCGDLLPVDRMFTSDDGTSSRCMECSR
jgi:hypothetical protein